MDAAPSAGHNRSSGASVRTRVTIPLRFADGYEVTVDAVTFHGLADGKEHVALVLGDPAASPAPLVRLHSECLTGDVFGSARCDCGPQLREAVERIATTGGVLLYLRQEGRGIGLYNKLDAYALQDAGLDTYEANTALGLPEDGRDYTAAAQMLTALGIEELDLLTNNPDKAGQLRDLGVRVRFVRPTGVFATDSNVRYLHAKVQHTHHTITLPEPSSLAALAV
ncbi:GTP cyclohydrolase II [Streptomyces sp. NBC_01092]|uniref:GTP cyclohydrolase II n=1 Tax=Streptomyces sp. NBC_01092 TaxID=2903748 RepID=UPI00386A93D9|nr:GTP cyclohydrolase II [Streptomyces sp. NBC_01092]